MIGLSVSDFRLSRCLDLYRRRQWDSRFPFDLGVGPALNQTDVKSLWRNDSIAMMMELRLTIFYNNVKLFKNMRYDMKLFNTIQHFLICGQLF